jgi:transposase
MSSRENQSVQEFKRLQGIDLHVKGWGNKTIAEALSVTIRSVEKWIKKFKEEGRDSLRARKRGPRTGTLYALSDEQQMLIQGLIAENLPESLALPYLLWSRNAVRELIQRELSVDLGVQAVGDYLARWGFTIQRPAKSAYEQEPDKVEAWMNKEYPRIERLAKKEGAVIYFADESRCQNKPGYERGYSPCGKTPVIKVSGSKRLAINFIACISAIGDMRFMTYKNTFTDTVFLNFLNRIIRGSEQKIFMIVDQLNVHKSLKVRSWLSANNDKIELFYLPTYSPELNPTEYLNQDLKRNCHRKGMPRNQKELTDNARSFLRKTQMTTGRVASYFKNKFVSYAAQSAN